MKAFSSKKFPDPITVYEVQFPSSLPHPPLKHQEPKPPNHSSSNRQNQIGISSSTRTEYFAYNGAVKLRLFDMSSVTRTLERTSRNSSLQNLHTKSRSQESLSRPLSRYIAPLNRGLPGNKLHSINSKNKLLISSKAIKERYLATQRSTEGIMYRKSVKNCRD